MQTKSFFSVFYTIFFLTGVPFALILWAMLNLPPNEAVIVGVVAGIIIGLPLSLMIRQAEVTFPREDSSDMILRVSAELADMGYAREHTYNKTTSYKPTVRAGMFADRIVINYDNADIMVFGPYYHVKKLGRRLGL